MTSSARFQLFRTWVLLPLLLSWGCAAGTLPVFADGPATEPDAYQRSDMGVLGSDVMVGSDSIVGASDSGAGIAGDSGVGPAVADSGAPPVVADSGAPPCQPSCTGKTCGDSDSCGGTCSTGSGCHTSCGSWQAVSSDDPWDDSDPNYDGERGCNGTLIKNFGRVSTEATCRTKCGNVAATCCSRDHRADHKSCRAYKGKVITVSSCTGCTAATCK